MFIYSNLYLPQTVSLRVTPTYSLKPNSDCPTYVLLDKTKMRNLEGELEEDLPESNLYIELDLDPESYSVSVLPSSSLSSLSNHQTYWWCLPTYPTWSFPWLLLLSLRDPCTPEPSSLPYCWNRYLHHLSPLNWIQVKSWRRNFPPSLTTTSLLLWI